jgi:Na+-transporting NADH:ubiquinone oxidoreductase subunit D
MSNGAETAARGRSLLDAISGFLNFGGKGMAALREQVWTENPIFRQILGICSALAVTNLVMNTFVMCAGVIFVTCFSSLFVSLLRHYTPKRIRMITQVLIISTFVIIVDLILKAYLPIISKQLGPYVGLIITNCIIMGRAEGFASRNTPGISFLDGLGASLGYSVVLLGIALVREPLGSGSILGYRVLGDWFMQWQIMKLPPGAFLALGIYIWIAKTVSPDLEEEVK